MKKVLATGSNGLLGQKLSDLYLHIPEVDFMATALGKSRHPSKKLAYTEMDVTQEEQVEKVVASFQPDCIIHAAAMTQVDDCEDNKALCDLLNVESVKFVSKAAQKLDAQLIHLSTDFIFDGEKGPYKETDQANPLSYYGHSKLRAEEYLQKYGQNWSILRTVLVYGLVHDMSRSNIVLWAKNALSAKQHIKVVDDQFRTPTLAEDLAMGCRLAEKKKAQGIFNISGKDFMSIYELVERVAKAFNLDMENVERVSSTTLNQKAKRPPKTGFDLSKAEKILGYQAKSFEEGIALIEAQREAYS